MSAPKSALPDQTSRLVWQSLAAALLVLPVSACNKSNNSLPEIPPPPLTVGMQLDDTVLTASVKSALIADPSIKSFDFKVQTRKGEVQLSGFADNEGQIQRATDLARGVAGVKVVINNMTVKK